MAQTSMKTDDLIIARGTEIDLEKIDLDTLKEAASGVEEVRFSFDGGHYVIDLNAANREEFAAVLRPYINAAGNVSASKGSGSGKKNTSGTEDSPEKRERAAARVWAQGDGKKAVTDAGYKIPGDRGRLSGDVLALYREHTKA